jgi:ferric-dicitrate binding protein FerR (iron transport regulator)
VIQGFRDAATQDIHNGRNAAAATIAVVGLSIALLVELLPQSGGPAIASTDIVQGDVRIRTPEDANWRGITQSDTRLAAGTRLRSTANGRIALTLAGTASLRVDAGSELLIANEREIVLTAGTIYLDTGANADDQGFVVTTGYGSVRDIGTQFEVHADPNLFRVRIREGTVELDTDAATAAIGNAGEQLAINPGSGLERGFFAPFDRRWEWVATLASAPDTEGQPLLLFLEWVARETGRELRFDAQVTETRARATILHGSAQNLRPLEALDLMMSTTDLDYVLLGDGVILIGPRGTGL